MPDTPRTLRDVLMQAGIDKWILTWPEGPTLADANSIAGVSLDALIGCQGRVVYTAEDVEAVRAAMAPYLYGEAFADLEFLDHIGEEKLLAMARAAITAAGGVVADGVGYVSKEGSLGCRDREGRHDVLPLLRGDILYIVRAKEE